jgi:hypothetical protein
MRLLILALLVVLWAVPAGAECGGASPTWTAANATQAEVALCVTAASAGDTINVPAGSETWTSAITVNKAISIIGAGSGMGGTHLTATVVTASGFFLVGGFTSSALVRISGFRFTIKQYVAGEYSAGIAFASSTALTSVRIDHNRFDYGNYQIYIRGAKGVIDHNDFYNGNKAIEFSAGNRAQADASWESMAAGTSDALFIEANNFIDNADYPQETSNEKISTANGGKLVIRYNVYDFSAIPHSGTTYPFMSHGNDDINLTPGYWQANSNTLRGQSVVEFYENTMTAKRCNSFFTARGSANLVYNNDLTATAQVGGTYLHFYEEEQEVGNWPAPNRTEWPAEDQVHNTFIWGNTYNGSAYFNLSAHIYVPTSSQPFIREHYEYHLHAPEATGGSESFTGLNGASGSYPTDGETLPTYGTMTFTGTGANAYYGYTAYTYPHPLAAAPTAPTNVRIR